MRCEPYSKPFGDSGDVIGCGWDLRSGEVFFTKNGVHLGAAFQDVCGELYPAVAVRNKHIRVRVNFGQQPFAWQQALEVTARASASEGPSHRAARLRRFETVNHNRRERANQHRLKVLRSSVTFRPADARGTWRHNLSWRFFMRICARVLCARSTTPIHGCD